jgi:hypothetical protein
LLLAFLVGTLRPSGPYAFLAIRASSVAGRACVSY